MANLATITTNILADSGIDDINVIVSTGSYANPAWITSLAWTKITGAPLGDYLPLAGGTMTGNINWAQTDRGLTWAFNTDGASIKFYNTADGDTDSRLEFATLDNNDEYFRWGHIPSGGSFYESMRLRPVSSGNAELIVTGKIIKSGGTTSQFLKANGDIDSTSYQPSITLTTTGTSGPATLVGATLNIPNYTENDTLQSVILRNNVTNTGFTISNSNNSYTSPANTNVPFIYLYNTGTTSTSNAVLSLRTNSATGGDPILSFDIGDVIGWSMGIDNSDSDKFKIANNWAALDSNTRFSMLTSGEATFTSSVTAASIIRSGGTSSQYLMADGSVSTLSNPVTGTGTTNYIPKWTSGSAIGNSLIFDNGTKVFIGTTTNNTISTGGLTLSNPTSSSLVLFNGGVIGFIYGSSVASGMAVTADRDLRFETGDGSGSNWPERMRLFQSTGNLSLGYGGGPIDNGFKLDVNGSLRVSGTAGNVSPFIIFSTTSANNTFNWVSTAFASNLAAGNNLVHFIGQAGSTKNSAYLGFKYQSSGSNDNILTLGLFGVDNVLNINGLGNVGIGTQTPSRTLDVNGPIRTQAGTIDLSNDFNNQIYSLSNALTFKTNGSDRLTISSTGAATFSSSVTATKGFFSSNAASDSTTALLANASTNDSTTYAAIFGSLNAGYRMVVRADGNVGIGTNNPAQKLSVQGEIAKYCSTGGVDGNFENLIKYGFSANLQSGTSDANRWIGIDATVTAGSAVTNTLRIRAYPGGFGNAAPVNVADFRGDQSSYFYGNVGIGESSPSSRLSVIGNATASVGLVNINNTQGASGSLHPALRVINDRGNHSYGTVAEFRIASTADTDRPSLLFSKGGTSNNWALGMSVYDGNHDNFAIGYRSNYPISTWATSYLSIRTNGNVLIGTTTDVGARLYVDGAFRTGTLTAGTQTAAVDWRLGNARGGAATNNALIRVQINGVLVDLLGNYV